MCNKITKPEFTDEQIAECQTCKHASGKKIWCCLFGVRISKDRIIQPSRKVIGLTGLKPIIRKSRGGCCG